MSDIDKLINDLENERNNPQWYYGIEGVTFIYHGDADAEVYYDGKICSEPEISDFLWALYQDECLENAIKPKECDSDEFCEYVRNYGYYVKDHITEHGKETTWRPGDEQLAMELLLVTLKHYEESQANK